jgi:cytidylate kinase
MERYNDSYDEALKQIKRSDDARSNYYKSISQLDWNDMHNYDICIDASLGVEKTVDILINYIKNR